MIGKLKARLGQFIERRVALALKGSGVRDILGDISNQGAALQETVDGLKVRLDDLSKDKSASLNLRDEMRHHINDFSAYKADYISFRDDIRARTRPYYYLGQCWGLTWLDTGLPFFVKTDEREISPWIILGGTWETYIDNILSEYILPGMTIVDIGANIGYYTIKFGSQVGPDGIVHAFEPNPVALNYLRENVLLNGFQGRCVVHPIAAGQESTTSKLYFTDEALGSGSLLEDGGNYYRKDHESLSKSVSVHVEPIDAILGQLDCANLIKIDAEGYEPFILRGAAELVRRSKDCAFLLEICSITWEKVSSIEETMAPILEGRAIYAVLPGSRLLKLEVFEIRGHLDQYENKMANFFICPIERIERIAKFIVRDI
jgi:FkbM family methyltransferase